MLGAVVHEPVERLELPMRLLLLTSALVVGCNPAPAPCTIACDPATPCPSDYACGGDARCHFVQTTGELAACVDTLPGAATAAEVGGNGAEPVAALPALDAAAPLAGAPTSTPAPPDVVWPIGGTIQVFDATLANTPRLGHGLSVFIELGPMPMRPQAYEEQAGVPTGCKATMLDRVDLPPPGGDEGTVTITGSTGVIPACTFVEGAGYRCVASHGTGGELAAAGAGLWRFTGTGSAFSNADVGRHLLVGGASQPANNGRFPIASVIDAETVIVLNNQPGAAAETLTGAWSVVAGAGPVPGAPDLLADGDLVTIALTPGGAGHVTVPATPPIDAGNAFTLDHTSVALLTAIPTTGKAVTLDCKGAGGKCPTGDGAAETLITLVTSDGDPASVGPYTLPPPASRQARIVCVSFDKTRVTIPAGAMAFVKNAAPTRIVATYARVGAAVTAAADGTTPVTAFVGHAFIGYTTKAQ